MKKKENIISISTRSFIVIMVVLLLLIALAGVSTYLIPQGSYTRIENEAGDIVLDPNSFVQGGIEGYPVWKWLTAPVMVLTAEGNITIIVISIFLLILSGFFTVMDKTGGIKVVIGRLTARFANRRYVALGIITLVFMLFGSFFGLFEELIALTPIVVIFALSMGFDTLVGMGISILAACFGFAAAITNPFTVGVASGIAGINILDGVWLRAIFFVIMYGLVCLFLVRYAKKVYNDPSRSITFKEDSEKRKHITDETNYAAPEYDKTARMYAIFFIVMVVMLIAANLLYADLVIPVLCAGFLIGAIVCGTVSSGSFGKTLKYFGSGVVAMLPAIVMILFASSVKYIITEGGVFDTIIHSCSGFLMGRSPVVSVLLIYGLVLLLEILVGSASAKAFLLMPIILPICSMIGISPRLAVLAFLFGDGFTNVIFPTNAALLVGLSIGGVSYGKWVKWTIGLQLIVLVLTAGILVLCALFGF